MAGRLFYGMGGLLTPGNFVPISLSTAVIFPVMRLFFGIAC